MKLKHLLIAMAVVLPISLCNSHGFKVSHFELRPDENGVSVHIEFDRHDFLKALEATCGDYNHLDKCFEEYVNKHVSFAFNDVKTKIHHVDHSFGDHHIDAHFRIDVNPTTVMTVEIFNDCLLEVFKDQENMVDLYFHDQRRSFRLNKDRVRTHVEYPSKNSQL